MLRLQIQTSLWKPQLITILNGSTTRPTFGFRTFSSSSSDYSNQSRGGLPRFFSETLPVSKGGVVRVDGDEFWHMTKVLRLGVNDRNYFRESGRRDCLTNRYKRLEVLAAFTNAVMLGKQMEEAGVILSPKFLFHAYHSTISLLPLVQWCIDPAY